VVFVDTSGNIFFSDEGNNRIREVVAATGNIQTVAGNGTAGFSGDSGPATSAELYGPVGVFVDGSGNIFIADATNYRIREVLAATGNIQTVAGNGTIGFSGDGGPATSAEVNFALSVSGDHQGNLFFSDRINNRIRKITGIVTGPPATIVASGGTPQSAAVNTAFAAPLSATVTDAFGNLVAGVVVTFSAPANGASGTFVGGSATATVVTNAQGIATSPAFTANTTVGGPYNVTAVVAGVAAPANFSLTNNPGPPASVTASSGTPQSTPISTAFASALAATVQDSFGNGVPGVNVTFTAPASGASGTFAGGSATATVATNAQGVATAPAFTANAIAGSPYNVTAAVAGVAAPANFSLTNNHGPAASVTGTGGTPQNTPVKTAFANPLAVKVTDRGGNAIPGVNVTFTAPASGASGTFVGGSATATVATNAQGIATSLAFTANSTAGGPYNVTAVVAGVAAPANFSLTNNPGPPSSVTASSGTPQSTPISTAFATSLAVTVHDASGNPKPGVNVTFTAPANGASGTFAGGSATATVSTDAQGIATSPAFTANSTAGGPYNVTAAVAGLQGSATFSLTNQPPPLQITTTLLGASQVGVPYSQTLTATGGTAPYTWSISSGALPAGLNLNSSTGAISGTALTAGSYAFTPKVTDSENPPVSQTLPQPLSIAVVPTIVGLQIVPQPSVVAINATAVHFSAQDQNGNLVPAKWGVSNGGGSISPTGIYSAPSGAAPGTTVTLTATAIGTTVQALPITFQLQTNGLELCCVTKVQPYLNVPSSAPQSNPTGVQLDGVPSTSTDPFTVTCSTLDSQGNVQPMPVGSGCIFTLPPSKGGTAVQSISGSANSAFCYVFVTRTTTSGANLPRPFAPWSRAPWQRFISPTAGLLALIAVLLGVRMRKENNAIRMRMALASLVLVCASVTMLAACNGFSSTTVTPPKAQVTPTGQYKVRVAVSPPAGSPYVQTQLIFPLTVM
jgi:hypothetical protein